MTLFSLPTFSRFLAGPLLVSPHLTSPPSLTTTLTLRFPNPFPSTLTLALTIPLAANSEWVYKQVVADDVLRVHSRRGGWDGRGYYPPPESIVSKAVVISR